MVTHQEKVRTSSPISELLLQLSLPSPGVYGGTSTDLPFSDLQQAGGVFGPTNKDVHAIASSWGVEVLPLIPCARNGSAGSDAREAAIAPKVRLELLLNAEQLYSASGGGRCPGS
jgi:hypothetical protein